MVSRGEKATYSNIRGQMGWQSPYEQLHEQPKELEHAPGDTLRLLI
ncbi:hypothetical protein [Legionella fairfieldensis]|nr:hypothetical protein [Legionella fairfieldensis]